MKPFKRKLSTLIIEGDDRGVVLCTFNRPEVHNALNLDMVADLREVLRELFQRDDVRVLVLTGAGDKAFISGADISELVERTGADALKRINTDLFRELEAFPSPTIAAISGYALGGGCELAMACDLRVCGESAKLGQPEVGLGIIPGAGGTYRLPKLVGLGRARELIFTGRIISAEEAKAIGLVNRVVPDADVVAEARALAHEIARNSPLAVRFAKRSLNLSSELSTEASMALESTSQAVLFDTADKRTRMTAFLKRKRK